jgi:galactose mutarotase-like enzyme
MDKITIYNNLLKASFLYKGAELSSIINQQNNYEFIWQANSAIWGRQAPVLFPIVGKLKENKIKINNRYYVLNQHGFARDVNFEIIEIYTDMVSFMLESTAETLQWWPYDFKLIISYKLKNNSLISTFNVINTGNEDMPFSIGAHPGFALPVHDLNQYEIQFNNTNQLVANKLQNGLISSDTFKVGSNKKLLLNSQIFKGDALVFKNIEFNQVQLKHLQSNFEVNMQFNGFNYFGIWNKYPEQSFICLEPWAGIADTIEATGNIHDKEGIIWLKAGQSLQFDFTTTFNT